MTQPTQADILAALTGQPTVQESAQADDTARAIAGRPSRAQEAQRRAQARAAGWDNSTPLGAGTSGNDDWIALTAVEAAKATMRDAILATDPKATAGYAEAQVEQALEAAYTTATEKHADEYARLDQTAQILKSNAAAVQSLTGGRVSGQ